MSIDHYATLGCPPDATPEQIKAAFRRARSAAHPDRHGGSEDQMKAVNRAYGVLSDAERRAFYDETGLDAPQQIPPQQLQDHLIEAQAEDCLAQCFKQLSEVDSDRRLFSQAAAMLASGVEKTGKAISQAEYRIKKLQARRERITVAAGARNTLHTLIDADLAGLRETVRQATFDRKVIEAAQVLLQAYDTTEPLFQEPSRHGDFFSAAMLATMASRGLR